MGPGGAAPNEDQPAIGKGVADARGRGREKVVARRELPGKDDARDQISDFARMGVGQAAPGRAALGSHDPSGGELIIASDLSTADESGRTEVGCRAEKVARAILADGGTE